MQAHQLKIGRKLKPITVSGRNPRHFTSRISLPVIATRHLFNSRHLLCKFLKRYFYFVAVQWVQVVQFISDRYLVFNHDKNLSSRIHSEAFVKTFFAFIIKFSPYHPTLNLCSFPCRLQCFSMLSSRQKYTILPICR